MYTVDHPRASAVERPRARRDTVTRAVVNSTADAGATDARWKKRFSCDRRAGSRQWSSVVDDARADRSIHRFE